MNFFEDGLQLTHPLVRDLVWCVFSPPLVEPGDDINGQPLQASEADKVYLQRLNRQPQALVEWMQLQPQTRLGLRFERFWQFWLLQRKAGNGNLQRFNLQIRSRGRTLGELDALEYDARRARLTHREMAVKFYLGIASDELPAEIRPAQRWSWVGANVSDRLDLKCQHLFCQQMHLLDKPEAANCLPHNWHWKSLNKQAIVRGRLFYPLDPHPDCDAVAPVCVRHLRGTWLHCRNLTQLRGSGWVILNREQRFAEVRLSDSEPRFNLPALQGRLQTHFQSSQQPLQIASVTLEENAWVETERLFVVPDHWPSTTRPA